MFSKFNSELLIFTLFMPAALMASKNNITFNIWSSKVTENTNQILLGTFIGSVYKIIGGLVYPAAFNLLIGNILNQSISSLNFLKLIHKEWKFTVNDFNLRLIFREIKKNNNLITNSINFLERMKKVVLFIFL